MRILFLKKNCLNVGVFLEKANFSTKIFFYDGPSVVKWYMWVFERSNNKLTKILANIVYGVTALFDGKTHRFSIFVFI